MAEVSKAMDRSRTQGRGVGAQQEFDAGPQGRATGKFERKCLFALVRTSASFLRAK